MKEKNQRDSRKRLNALILLVAFTAILLIVSTYAWFSTHKTVKLGGLEGKVNVAEGLQISLDALNWTNEIDLTKGAEAYFAQTNADLGLDGSDGKAKLDLTNPWKASSDGKLPYEARTNLVPSELKPVSTTAKAESSSPASKADGIGLNDVNMYKGENTDGIVLSGIDKVTPDNTAGYYAIDFFLQNSSSENSISKNIKDVLRLEGTSAVKLAVASKESTGLQNTFRIGFAVYDDDGTAANTMVSNTPNQAQILSSTTGNDRTIQDFAIWEPNANGAQVKGEAGAITKYAAHVNYILQNNNRVTFSSKDTTDYKIKNGKFAAEQAIPTYALTSKSAVQRDSGGSIIKGTGEIDDIYDWSTPATGLEKQVTVQTSNNGFTDPLQLKSIKDGTTDFSIDPGKYVRLRMYVWLEGQDVDCINYASLGGALTLDISISKPGASSESVPKP